MKAFSRPLNHRLGYALIAASIWMLCAIRLFGDDTSQVNVDALLADTCDSTVRIEGVQRSGRYTVRSHGAGVVVSGDGYIVTALHVVEGFPKVVVKTRDGQALSARPVRSSSKLDLALLKCKPLIELKSAFFRPPAQSENGDEIVAVGNPGGRGQVARAGVLGETRTVQWCNTEASLRAVTAPIRPGYSGGGSYDMGTGELVGIQVAQSATRPDIGYIVPEEVVHQWVSEGRALDPDEVARVELCRKRLGCWLRPVQLNHPNYKAGLMVTKIEADGPADKSHWHENDVLVALDQFKTKSVDEIEYVLERFAGAEPIRFRLVRQSEVRKGSVVLAKAVGMPIRTTPVSIEDVPIVASAPRIKPAAIRDAAKFLAHRHETHPDVADSFEVRHASAAELKAIVEAGNRTPQLPTVASNN